MPSTATLFKLSAAARKLSASGDINCAANTWWRGVLGVMLTENKTQLKYKFWHTWQLQTATTLHAL